MKDQFSLEGKVALVTGGTYGIGMAMAKALGKAGAKIIFNARTADKVKEAEFQTPAIIVVGETAGMQLY